MSKHESLIPKNNPAMLETQHPVLMRFKTKRPQTLEAFRARVCTERKRSTDVQGQPRTNKDKPVSMNGGVRPCPFALFCLSRGERCPFAFKSGVLVVDRQVARVAKDFENEGGFTERLYRVLRHRRDGGSL